MVRWIPAWLRWVFGAIVVALVARFLVVPRLTMADDAFAVATDLDPVLVLVGTGLFALAVVAEAQLTRSSLAPGSRPAGVDMVRIELAAMAVAHTVPGGTAAGSLLAFRLLTRGGVGEAEAGVALATRGLGSAVVLNGLLWVALVVSIPLQGFRPVYTVAALLGAGSVALLGAAVLLLVRGEERLADLLGRVTDRLPGISGDGVRRGVGRVAAELRDLTRDRARAASAGLWSAAWWLLGAASLWVFLAAFGVTFNPVSLLVAYGVANVMAFVPITPQGLGVVEAVLIPSLVWFGAGADAASLAVIAWRLVSFWAPIPLGGLSYVSLRMAPAETGGPEVERRDAVEELIAAMGRHRPRDASDDE